MISRLTSARRLLVLLVLGVLMALPATAGAASFPDTIPLPDGWQPEGIAAGRINPRTGLTREVDLGGASLVNGDGMLLAGRVLFVVQNRDNKIAVVVLSRSLDRGRVVAELTDPDFDVPTTIAATAGHLYAVNARFGTTDPQPARYDIVRVG
jgi:hypothetical protein